MPSPTVRVLGIPGSYRTGSLNRRLLHVAAAAVAEAGGEVAVIDLRALDLPIYDGDLEEATGLPAGAQELKQRIAAADGLLVASPEYNGSLPGGLKNAIDWATRPSGDNPFAGKPCATLGASPGPFGTVRGQMALRHVLSVLGALVLPGPVHVPRAGDAFDEAGALTDPRLQQQVKKLAAVLVDELRRRRLPAPV